MGELRKALKAMESERILMREAASLLSSSPMSDLLPGGITYIPAINRANVMLPATEAETYMDGLKAQHDELLKGLKDNEQLVMICWHGHERLQVTNIEMPSDNVVAMHCIDETGATIQVTGHMNALTLSFRVLKIEPPAVRKLIGFAMPNSN